MRVSLDKERRVISWISVPGNLQSELGWWFMNSLCLTSRIWTAENPAKALQKLCQLKEAGQNVVWLPWNREMSTMEAAGKLCFTPSAASSLSLWQIKPLFLTAWFSISDADSSQKETSGNLNLWWSKSEFDTGWRSRKSTGGANTFTVNVFGIYFTFFWKECCLFSCKTMHRKQFC